MKVPFLDLSFQTRAVAEEVRAGMERVLTGSQFVLGPDVSSFEQAFADYCDTRHAVGVASGLDALKLILRASHIGPGDEVITAANSFIASALAVSSIGARPVLADVDPVTLLMTADTVRDHITSRTRAIMPVHLFGTPVDMDPLLDLAATHDVWILEDAAQAHGALYKGKKAGSLGRAAGFSFYPGKNLGAFGDAGAVTTSDDACARSVRQLRNYGSDRKYYHEVAGENSRLDTLQAVVLAAKLKRLDEWNAHRRRVADWYGERLIDVPDVRLRGVTPEAISVHHLFVIRAARRDELMTYLRDHEVETLIHYPVPIHLQKAYADAGWVGGEFPVAEEAARQMVSLPMGPHLQKSHVDYICEHIRSFYGA